MTRALDRGPAAYEKLIRPNGPKGVSHEACFKQEVSPSGRDRGEVARGRRGPSAGSDTRGVNCIKSEDQGSRGPKNLRLKVNPIWGQYHSIE